MSRRSVFDRTLKSPIRTIDAKIKEIKVGTMRITTKRVIMFEMGITTKRVIMFERETKTTTTTSTGVTMEIKMIRVGPMCQLKIGKLLLGMV